MEKEQVEYYVEELIGPYKLQISILTKRVEILWDRLKAIETHVGLPNWGNDPPPNQNNPNRRD